MLHLALMLLLTSPVLASSTAAAEAIAHASGAALQADALRAVAALKSVPAHEFEGKDAQFRKCMLERFSDHQSDAPDMVAPDSFAARVLALYRNYWRAALSRPDERAQAEEVLTRSLGEMLGAKPLRKFQDIERLAAEKLRSEGQHSIQGMTGRLRELIIWNKQEERDYAVLLPEGARKAHVVLLDGFLSHGWAHYATCGRRAAGGWARGNVLYAVVPRYESLDHEQFRVSFLAHETQHSADSERFRGIAAWELEYRAKLTEVAMAEETRGPVLQKLMEDQSDNPASPHSYANKRVIAALARRLGGGDLSAVQPDQLQRAAVLELAEDTMQRSRK